MSLHVAYRPTLWKHVVGQDKAVRSLRRMVESGQAQTYLLSGPSGTGKTTLARIAAVKFGCTSDGIFEVDAASNSSIENMRALQEGMNYQALGSGKRAYLIDEAHGLSRQAWDSMLKMVEEPPAHVAWFFCTTNVAKVPATIKTRCQHIQLKPVEPDALHALVADVCDKEGITLVKGVADMIVKMAEGSPRQALVNLETARDAESREEAGDMLRAVMETDDGIALCRFLMRPGSWSDLTDLLEKLDGQDPEGIRRMVLAYYGKVAGGAKNANAAGRAIKVIDAFADPYPDAATGKALLLRSIGMVMLM